MTSLPRQELRLSGDGPAEPDWREGPPLSEFGEMLGPLLRRRVDDRWAYGFEARDAHRNSAGIVHGGALMALIDEVIGTMVADAVGRSHVTVHAAVTFLQRVQVGDFIEPVCTITTTTRSMTFVDAKLMVGGTAVATATLIFKAVRAAAQVAPGAPDA
jgi:acyl-coenzyme A thioesterase PaaI-like protein